MPQKHSLIVTYACDECMTEFEVEGIGGLSPPLPLGWLSIQGAPTAGDIFCSWNCLGTYALRTGQEKEKAAGLRAKERKAMAEAAKKAGGVV